MPQLGLALDLTRPSFAGDGLDLTLFLPLATTSEITILGFTDTNANWRLASHNYTLPNGPLVKQGSSNPIFISDTNFFNGANSKFELSYTSGTKTWTLSLVNTTTSSTITSWSATGTATLIPKRGWVGGQNSGTDELELIDPNSLSNFVSILDSFTFTNNSGAGGTYKTSSTQSGFRENVYIYQSGTSSTLSNLFDINFLRKASFLSSADTINVFPNPNIYGFGTSTRRYRAYVGTDNVWRISAGTDSYPELAAGDYPIQNGDGIYIIRHSSSTFRFLPILNKQKVFKRAIFSRLKQGYTSISVTDYDGFWTGTYVPTDENSGIYGEGIFWIPNTYKYLASAGAQATDGRSFQNWSFYNDDGGYTLQHFSTNPLVVPQAMWNNTIVTQNFYGPTGLLHWIRTDISIT
jgi:hypothetical protein